MYKIVISLIKKIYRIRYESSENMVIQCSTKVCSFGKQVVEKVETEYARYKIRRAQLLTFYFLYKRQTAGVEIIYLFF